MPARARIASVSLLALIGCLTTGCCQPYGWVLKGDCALELNRVAFIGSRADCYEGCGSCAGGGHEGSEDYEPSGSYGPYGTLDPAFHPVPMKPPYGAPPYDAPTRAPEGEDLPTPPQEDNVRAPAASVPRRLSDSAERASWSFGRKRAKPMPSYGPARQDKALHVWRPTRS